MQEIVRRQKRPFLRGFLKLALPIMGQTLMIAAMQVVDNVLVGQLQQGRALLGEYTISGVAQANRLAFLFQITAAGMAGGASAFFAQYWGKRDRPGIDRTLSLGIVAGLIAALMFAIPSILAPGWVLKPLINSEEALWYGSIYLRVVALSFFPYAVSAMLGASLKSTERVVLPMLASLAGAAIDALMSYILIFGKFGAPRLEVAGAAAGSVLGVLAELVILLAVGLRKRHFSLSALTSILHVPSASSADSCGSYCRWWATNCCGRWPWSPIRLPTATWSIQSPRPRRSPSTPTSSSWRRWSCAAPSRPPRS